MTKVPRESSIGFLSGMWFVFHDEQGVVALWASLLTGKIKVFVNQRMVWSGRQLGRAQTHQIEVGGIRYAFDLAMKDARKCEFECVVRKNGTKMHRYNTELVRKFSMKREGVIILAGSIPFWVGLIIWQSWFAGFVISLLSMLVLSWIYPSSSHHFLVRETDI